MQFGVTHVFSRLPTAILLSCAEFCSDESSSQSGLIAGAEGSSEKFSGRIYYFEIYCRSVNFFDSTVKLFCREKIRD